MTAAVHHKLDNMTVIVDLNGLQIDGPVEKVMGRQLKGKNSWITVLRWWKRTDMILRRWTAAIAVKERCAGLHSGKDDQGKAFPSWRTRPDGMDRR